MRIWSLEFSRIQPRSLPIEPNVGMARRFVITHLFVYILDHHFVYNLARDFVYTRTHHFVDSKTHHFVYTVPAEF